MSRVNRRKLKLADVQITIDAEEEDLSINGHFEDEQTAREVIESYNDGNSYAWCCAIVTAKWIDPAGVEHVGRDILGGVSCLPTEDTSARESFDDLVKYHGMSEQALEDLQRAVNSHDRRLLQDQILDTVQSLSDATLKNWVKRGFPTVAPIARLELKRRAIK